LTTLKRKKKNFEEHLHSEKRLEFRGHRHAKLKTFYKVKGRNTDEGGKTCRTCKKLKDRLW